MQLNRKYTFGTLILPVVIIYVYALLIVTLSSCDLHRKGSVIKGSSAKVKRHNNVASAKRTYKKNRH